MKVEHKAYVYLHIAVLLWGFTAILGDLIQLNAISLVWWRVALTSLILFFWPGLVKQLRALEWRLIKRYTFIGFLVGLHWICFYGSIKLANASTALIAMSTTALFTAFLEPLMTGKKLAALDIILSLLIVPAMALTVYGFKGTMLLGFWVGIGAAFLAAYFAVLNKKSIDLASSELITWIEMVAASILLSIILPIVFYWQPDIAFVPSYKDLGLLLVLSIFCTILPYILHLKSLEQISAFASNLIVNLEPVYGILMAIFILKEHKELNGQFYLGVSIIILIIMIYPYLKRVTRKRLRVID